MTENAYRVKGEASHAGVIGWVNPNHLASKDKDFISNLKKLYERQMIVKELIANKEVAIGMTLDEVSESMGQPTETEVEQTREGMSGKWDYVITEEQKHYRTIIDPRTGNAYRQLSHITTEERARTTVKFKENIITSVTRKKNNGPGKVRIVPAPIIFHW
jgi:outer membrane protein assembly factor BamE (lipoprotein component of BamABCDE complex)